VEVANAKTAKRVTQPQTKQNQNNNKLLLVLFRSLTFFSILARLVTVTRCIRIPLTCFLNAALLLGIACVYRNNPNGARRKLAAAARLLRSWTLLDCPVRSETVAQEIQTAG